MNSPTNRRASSRLRPSQQGFCILLLPRVPLVVQAILVSRFLLAIAYGNMSSPSTNTTRIMQHAQSSSPSPSLVTGPRTPELWNYTMGELITMQAAQFGNHTATIFSWQRQRLSYQDLAQRSEEVARSMLASGLKHGDCVAIMAGNCYQYIETFLAAARIGCPFVVLNNTYSPKEVVNALQVVRKLYE